MLSIERNPKNKVYDELIDLCFEVCDEFHLVIRTDMGFIGDLPDTLKVFNDSFKIMKKESEWASTMLGDEATADVYYFKTDEHAKEIVKSKTKSLFDWIMPSLPEDLSFFKDGEVWMATSSHEKECFLYPKDEEEASRIKSIKGLKVKEMEG
nr:stage III sporulation protein AH [Bacillus sp.] [Bacillus sp. (in: firmicutes)]